MWIEGALASRRKDGYFGPSHVAATVSSTSGKYDLWPNMVMLNALESYYEFSGDNRVLDLMTKYSAGSWRCRKRNFSLPSGNSSGRVTTWPAFTGFITARATRGCWTWPPKFIGTRPTGPVVSPVGTTSTSRKRSGLGDVFHAIEGSKISDQRPSEESRGTRPLWSGPRRHVRPGEEELATPATAARTSHRDLRHGGADAF